ncbi:unnamed protein product [Vitrella brassicaformis CCMP3155]|uniref:PAS domain-containing protein n=1 Tax=Vitrella brassicaformis (strain CCMP3155) TaxID=1169540 RepID=A0A0G4F392_VITBC|nr:unnamed protein product [Vitrella brassicaformis CCMP3155]|eukprot:CEM06647.1 unnamed protein product [Vitrella brassicaformis CCMP3155]
MSPQPQEDLMCQGIGTPADSSLGHHPQLLMYSFNAAVSNLTRSLSQPVPPTGAKTTARDIFRFTAGDQGGDAASATGARGLAGSQASSAALPPTPIGPFVGVPPSFTEALSSSIDVRDLAHHHPSPPPSSANGTKRPLQHGARPLLSVDTSSTAADGLVYRHGKRTRKGTGSSQGSQMSDRSVQRDFGQMSLASGNEQEEDLFKDCIEEERDDDTSPVNDELFVRRRPPPPNERLYPRPAFSLSPSPSPPPPPPRNYTRESKDSSMDVDESAWMEMDGGHMRAPFEGYEDTCAIVAHLKKVVKVSVCGQQALTFCAALADPTLDDCPLVVVSSSFCRLTGYSPWELLTDQLGLLEALEHQDTDVDAQLAVYTYVDSLLQSNRRHGLKDKKDFVTTLLSRRKDGSSFENLLVLRPASMRGRLFLVALCADVTSKRFSLQPADLRHAIQSAVHELLVEGEVDAQLAVPIPVSPLDSYPSPPSIPPPPIPAAHLKMDTDTSGMAAMDTEHLPASSSGGHCHAPDSPLSASALWKRQDSSSHLGCVSTCSPMSGAASTPTPMHRLHGQDDHRCQQPLSPATAMIGTSTPPVFASESAGSGGMMHGQQGYYPSIHLTSSSTSTEFCLPALAYATQSAAPDRGHPFVQMPPGAPKRSASDM